MCRAHDLVFTEKEETLQTTQGDDERRTEQYGGRAQRATRDTNTCKEQSQFKALEILDKFLSPHRSLLLDTFK